MIDSEVLYGWRELFYFAVWVVSVSASRTQQQPQTHVFGLQVPLMSWPLVGTMVA